MSRRWHQGRRALGLGVGVGMLAATLGAVTAPAGGGLIAAAADMVEQQASSWPLGPGEEPPSKSPTYAKNPPFRSFWPAKAPYVPPSKLPQTRTVVPAGTPDSKCCGPMTDEGKASWVWSEYELQTLSWGNAASVLGNAGSPQYIRQNINNTPVRQQWISTFDSWIRATYTPMGAIPQPFRDVYPDKVTQDHLPIRYGATEVLYSPVVKGGRIALPPSPPFGSIAVVANSVPGDNPAWSFNVPGSNYAFTMNYDREFRPTEPRQAAALTAEAARIRARLGIDAPVYILSRVIVVLLTRDNRMPMRQMAIGETLDMADAGIRRQQEQQPSAPEMYAKRLQTVQRLRALHARNLNAPVFVNHIDFTHQAFYTDDDLFAPGDRGNRYPLYTFDPSTYAAAKTDQPQWIAITFPRLVGSYSWAERMVHDTMADHFNYAYVRDAIFDPQKVAGVAYQPRP